MRIDPWSTVQYENYGRLMEQFGIQEMEEKDWKDLPNPPHFFRRGIIFGHRDFGRIKNKISFTNTSDIPIIPRPTNAYTICFLAFEIVSSS